MLKHILALMSALFLLMMPAAAQSVSDIAAVKSGKSCPECNLFQADFSYQGIRNLDLSNARLRQSSLSLSTMSGVDFSGSNLSVANLFGAHFIKSDFSDANLQDAVLVGAYFEQANFRGANLKGANLSGTDLQQANGLTQRQLNQACGDQYTKLRGGLTIPRCK